MTSYCEWCAKKHEAKGWKSFFNGDDLITVCDKWYKPSGSPEIIPERVKNERKEYSKSLLQPWRQGEPSSEYIEAYPDKAKQMFTPKEIIKAKPVWKDILPNKWQKTK